MKFDLDDTLLEDILFHMENQDSIFVLDTQEGQVITDMDIRDIEEDEDTDIDDERFIDLPDWSPSDGYRLMEKFATGLKNPVVRQKLSSALNRGKGVFRAFRDVLEQYPETEKMWFTYKDKKMKEEVVDWYNSLREEWGLKPVGSEPEDTSSLVLEDFVFRPGKSTDAKNAIDLHRICIDERDDEIAWDIYKSLNKFEFPGDVCFIAENAAGDLAGYIYAVKDEALLQIHQLEVKPEYRGMGLGKTLLAKLIEKAESKGWSITIDLPAGVEFFSRDLHLEGFKPCLQRFVRE